MPERRAKQGEPEHTQADPLNVSFRLVQNDCRNGNCGDGERKQRNEKPVPVIECCEVHGHDSEHDDGPDHFFAK